MSAIQHPQPKSTSPQPSQRLLASHHSIYEALQERSASSSPLPQSQSVGNTPALLNLEFSATSWQSITDSYLAARPTSSVLSSSDTEEDDAPIQNSMRSTTAAILPKSDTNSTRNNDEEKTIEINLNEGVKQHNLFASSAMTGSSFVIPEMLDDGNYLVSTNGTIQTPKILIIGHKKHNFYKHLDKELQSKFTLNLQDPHKIIIVIFDGLIKIGNILNFIRNNVNRLNEKLIIPIFRNLNAKIVDKILRIHNVELLCPPVSLDNNSQLQNLLDFLREDFLLEPSLPNLITSHEHTFASFPDSPPLPPMEITPEDFQLIRLNSQNSSQSEYSTAPLIPPSPPTRSVSSKSVVITHQVEHLRRSKKTRHRKRYPRWSLLGMSLTMGIGIGITVALGITYYKTRGLSSMEVMKKERSIKSTIMNGLHKVMRSVRSMTKDEAHSMGTHVSKVSKLVYQGTKTYIQDMKSFMQNVWNGSSEVAKAGYQHPMFWYL
ncbi:CYFA0S07e04588g1_1 [Cyberlindnera fabianii]|uniref:CYFA0S07e04588g1_1 n=1 Tax=Cyberlindnera fabianii TaxID=36022 RepID=A0A061B3Q7_CYBFA|nr:CYFA0S07e04588g1_1 [Cyberlindnera fabianii]